MQFLLQFSLHYVTLYCHFHNDSRYRIMSIKISIKLSLNIISMMLYYNDTEPSISIALHHAVRVHLQCNFIAIPVTSSFVLTPSRHCLDTHQTDKHLSWPEHICIYVGWHAGMHAWVYVFLFYTFMYIYNTTVIFWMHSNLTADNATTG